MGIDTKTYIALSVVMFLEYAIWGAWAPVLAARLLGPLKMTGKQTGWIYATLPIACIVSPLAAGWLGDQYVSNRWILIVAHFLGAVLLFLAARQNSFKPLFVVMLLYSLCYAATLPLVNAVLFAATAGISDSAVKLSTQGNVFIWAPLAWALVGWALTGWRMSRRTPGDGSDCLVFAAALSIMMALGCFLLPDNVPARSGEIPIVEAFEMLGNLNFLLFIVVSMVIAGLMQFYFLGTAQFLQDQGVSSKHVPASMALAQIAQAAATFFLLGIFLTRFEFKWTLAIGAGCWFLLYVIYVIGKPKALLIAAQPLHGLAYVFFMIVGQIFAESMAPEHIRSSMQALIFAATTGVGLFFGTQFAGIVMDKNSVDGKFQWSKIWIVPCVITLIGALVLAALFQKPAAAEAPAADPSAPVSARDV
ncbi:MAG: MFS transporter [Pirellulaceae bacterium]